MIDWWNGLTTLNQVFYVIATFFSVIFIWQLISALVGLAGGEGDLDADMGADVDLDGDMDFDGLEGHSVGEAADSLAAFRILSIRAVLAFGTLFSWAASLYLNVGKSVSTSLLYAILWGLAGGVIVTILVRWLRGLAETGNPQLRTCVGARGMVYMDIPGGAGQGKVRVPVSGVISMVRARALGGDEMEAGTPVRVVRMLDANTVEVQPIEPEDQGKEPEQ